MIPHDQDGQSRVENGCSLRRTIGFVLSVVLLAGVLHAQQPPASPDPRVPVSQQPPAERPWRAVEYVGPDTYILLDDQGRSQPVLGMKYEQFMAAWQRAGGAAPHVDQPRYTIEQLLVTGRTDDGYAELQLELTVRLLSDVRLEIPLGLGGAILRSQPRIRAASADAAAGREDLPPAPSQPYVDFDPQRGGFVAGFEGRPDQRFTLSLPLLVPLVRDGGATTLSLTCPRAVVRSMSLRVAGAVTDASASGGSIVSQQATGDDGGTELRVEGMVGDFRLTWRTADEQAELATVLSAIGTQLISIDGRSVRTDAHLSVRSHGGSFDQFRVRLPPGAKLIQTEHSEPQRSDGARRLAIEPAEPTATAGADGRILRFRLAERQQGPVEVDLSTEQPLGLGASDREVTLGGFEVVDAVRQFGDVGLSVAEDWQLFAGQAQNVRQVNPDDLSPTLQQHAPTAAFQYDRQPWSLRVQVARRQSHVHVSPAYELKVFPDEARLTAHLEYQVTGARVFEFRVDLRGWELTAAPIESAGLVDRDRTLQTDEGVLILPLAQAAARRTDITLDLRRALPAAPSDVELPLPVPSAGSSEGADLTVLVEPGFDFVPDLGRSLGLTIRPLDDVESAPTDPAGRHALRFRSHGPTARLVAHRINRPRDVSTQTSTELNVTPSELVVRQRVAYDVRYQPIQQLRFDWPAEWPTDGPAMEAALVDEATGAASQQLPLTFDPPAADTSAQDESAGREVLVTLPQPRIDRFDVQLSYQIDRPSEVATTALVPLLQPADGTTDGQRVTIHAPAHLMASLGPAATGTSWRPEESSNASAAAAPPRFIAAQREAFLPLAFQRSDPAATGAPIVERIWLQTWLAGEVRQDRCAFHFRSQGDRVVVELPPTIAAGEVEVLVDGRLATVEAARQGRLTVQLSGSPEPNSANGPSHTLELRYRQPAPRRGLAVSRLTPPQLVGATGLGEVYWHIVLPGDELLVRPPEQLAAIGSWQWLGSIWGRRPALTQHELEAWIGAKPQLAPSDAQMQYLFSGLSSVASIEIATAPRWLIVLASSGAVLALALLWIYVPLLRRGPAIVAAALTVAVLAFAFPEAAVLVGQASVVGLVVVTAVMLAGRVFPRRYRPVPPALSGSSFRGHSTQPESLAVPTGTTRAPPIQLSDSQR